MQSLMALVKTPTSLAPMLMVTRSTSEDGGQGPPSVVVPLIWVLMMLLVLAVAQEEYVNGKRGFAVKNW